MKYVTPAIAFLISVAFVPGIAGAATSPRWAIAAISLWFMEWPALAFSAICFAALEFDQAVHWAIVSAAFCWGMNAYRNRPEDIRLMVVWFSAGVFISGCVAIAQSFGWSAIPQVASPGGLFLNKNVMGEAAALAFIAAASTRLWPAALICIPAIIFSQSRAAWLATFAGLFFMASWPWRFVLLSFSLLSVLGLYFTKFDISSDTLIQRFMLWQDALNHLTIFGNGSYDYSTVIHREPNLHNDWLQLIYELGIFGLIPIAAILLAGGNGALPFVAALLVVGSFGFPLHNPASAWFAAFVIGHCVGRVLNDRGSALHLRNASSQLSGFGLRQKHLPVPEIHRSRPRTNG